MSFFRLFSQHFCHFSFFWSKSFSNCPKVCAINLFAAALLSPPKPGDKTYNETVQINFVTFHSISLVENNTHNCTSNFHLLFLITELIEFVRKTASKTEEENNEDSKMNKGTVNFTSSLPGYQGPSFSSLLKYSRPDPSYLPPTSITPGSH